MVEIGLIHYIYILLIILIIILMILKKDIVLICILGLFIMGLIYHKSVLDGIETIYKGVIVSGNEFWSIIVTISLIVSMSNALRDIGADVLMIKPFNRFIKNPSVAFWVIGLLMMVFSFVLWPSPAVALIGAIILPVAVKVGLPPIWAAVAMNLFGHGVALSGDYFIQGAPAITAKAIGVSNPSVIMKAELPMWAIMSIITVITAYIMMIRDIKKNKIKEKSIRNKSTLVKEKITDIYNESDERQKEISIKEVIDEGKGMDNRILSDNKGETQKEEFDHNSINNSGQIKNFWVRAIAFFTPIIFLVNVYLMYRYQLKGGDAAALLTGSAVFITIFCVAAKENFKNVLSKLGALIKDGFIFGIGTFAPVLVVGAFFFLGNQDTAVKILGDNARGYLGDLGLYLSNKISLSVPMVIIIQAASAGISGLGGAGFSALPLVGTIAGTLSKVVNIDLVKLAAFGQIFAMWVGGGTVIPWGVIPVAAICKVNAIELVRKNLIPVGIGFVVTIVTAIIIF